MTLQYTKIDGIVKVYIEGSADEVSAFVRRSQERRQKQIEIEEE